MRTKIKTLTDEDIAEIRRNPPRILTTHEAAALYGVPVRTVQGWTKMPGFPGQGVKPKSNVYVDSKDLKKWLKSRFRMVRRVAA